METALLDPAVPRGESEMWRTSAGGAAESLSLGGSMRRNKLAGGCFALVVLLTAASIGIHRLVDSAAGGGHTGCDAKPDCGHGTCTTDGSKHTCNCQPGWSGDDCKHQETAFAVMFDAGSSGTRAHVYSWPYASDCGQRINRRQMAERGAGLKVVPGLSTLAQDTSRVRGYLGPLLDFVREAVPGSLHSTTPIYLHATAGLRLLYPKDQKALIGAVKAVFGTSGFNFADSNAAVISGQDEGANEWATVNYLRGTLGGNLDTGCYNSSASSLTQSSSSSSSSSSSDWPAATLGMGGASTQIAFSPAADTCRLLMQVHQGFNFTFKDDPDTPCGTGPHSCTPTGLHDAIIYVHSYLGLGATEAQLRLRDGLHTAPGGKDVDDPCLLRGYSITTPISRCNTPNIAVCALRGT